jgi:hypothetical protein
MNFGFFLFFRNVGKKKKRNNKRIQIIGIRIIFNLKIKAFSISNIIKLSDVVPIINSIKANIIEV